LWKGQVGVAPAPDSAKGWVTHFDDFIGSYNVPTADTAFDRYAAFSENSGTVATTPGAGGILRLTTGATADNATSFGLAGLSGIGSIGVGSPGALTSLGTRMIFEARIRVASVADAVRSFFVGLGAAGSVANDGCITDAHVVGAKSVIGFASIDADGDSLTTYYNVASGTLQTIAANASAIEADTWYKVGMIYDPSGPDSKKLRFFFDGVELPTGLTKAQIEAAAFPGGTLLAPFAEVKTDAGAAHTLDVDWLAFAYEEV
jgi:hypothetical protein